MKKKKSLGINIGMEILMGRMKENFRKSVMIDRQ